MTIAVATPYAEMRARFAALAAPTPSDQILWRADADPVERKNQPGEYFARFVPYIDAHFARERFDAHFAGEWGVTLDIIKERYTSEGKLEEVVIKARLTVAGVTREGIGADHDHKSAETDAFKRAAVRFGIAADLYKFSKNWVPMDGPGKWAKPKVDPGVYYTRAQARMGKPERDGERPTIPPRVGAGETTPGSEGRPPTTPTSPTPTAPPPSAGTGNDFKYASIACPKCGARMWDNRTTKSGRQPDYKCTRNKQGCNGAVWLDSKSEAPVGANGDDEPDTSGFPPELADQDDDLPF